MGMAPEVVDRAQVTRIAAVPTGTVGTRAQSLMDLHLVVEAQLAEEAAQLAVAAGDPITSQGVAAGAVVVEVAGGGLLLLQTRYCHRC